MKITKTQQRLAAAEDVRHGYSSVHHVLDGHRYRCHCGTENIGDDVYVPCEVCEARDAITTEAARKPAPAVCRSPRPGSDRRPRYANS